MGHWIFGNALTDKKRKNVHTYYRHMFFAVDGAYTLKITADDYYKLYINGKFVASGPAPSYHFAYNYNTLDVSDYIVPGENIIAVHCYYHGEVDYAHTSGDGRIGLWAQLLCNGEIILETDETWKWAEPKHFLPAGDPVGYETQFMENVDMRKYEKGWNELEYDDCLWKYSTVNVADDHILTQQITPVVDVYEVFPEKVLLVEKNKIFLDFGKEICAGIKVDICGKRGSEVYIRYGEELNQDGSVRYDMRCNVRYEEKLILSGDRDLFENYDYKGFRYVEIENADNAMKEGHFSAIARHSKIKDRLVFETKDEKLSKIAKICENAVIIGTQDGFLDCPTREKGQYLGDMLVTAISHAYVTGDHRMYRKALVDFSNSLKVCPGMSAVSPSERGHGIADFSLMYPMQLLKYYHLTGDKAFLKRMLEPAEETVAYFKRFERNDGLLECVNTKINLVDWPENFRDGYDFDLSHPVGAGCHNVINAYYYGAMKCLNEIRDVLGMEPKHDTERFRNAYICEFYHAETGLFTDIGKSGHSTLHSNVLPVFFEMTGKAEAEEILDWLETKGLNCGTFFAYFLLKAFVKHGRYEQVYHLIVSEGQNSWLNMVREGATACFEAWGKDRKWNTSLCHPWASAPLIILVEDFAGIQYKHGRPEILPLDGIQFDSRIELKLNGACLNISF